MCRAQREQSGGDGRKISKEPEKRIAERCRNM